MTDFFSWLASAHGFSSLVDIGANDGAFGAFLKRTFRIETVHAIEPLARHTPTLQDRGFTVHRVALSDYEDEADLIVSGNDSASSLLPPSALCLSEYPQVMTAGFERVRVTNLDALMLALNPPTLIKIDAQGSEAAIIRGGRETFAQAAAVLVEMSFVPLYDGSSLFADVHAELAALSFAFRGIRKQHEAANGEPLFAHCLYLRSLKS